MKSFLVIFAVVLFSCPAWSEEKLPKWVTDSGAAWQPPAEGVVRDKWAAIEIAHAAWFSVGRRQPASVDLWQKNFDATLADGVWEVTEKTGPEVGGSVFVFVSQKDGRILSIFMTQ